MRICKADLQLLRNRGHFDMAEKLNRGGVSSVFAKRLVTANNKCVTSYDPASQALFYLWSTRTISMDGSLRRIPFRWTLLSLMMQQQKKSRIWTRIHTERGLNLPWSFTRCTFGIPVSSHKRDSIEKVAHWGSTRSIEKYVSLEKNGTTAKLIQNFFTKKSYMVHYPTLQ